MIPHSRPTGAARKHCLCSLELVVASFVMKVPNLQAPRIKHTQSGALSTLALPATEERCINGMSDILDEHSGTPTRLASPEAAVLL